MPRVVILSAFATPFRSGAEACAEEVAARLKGKYDSTIVTARLRRDLPRDDHLPSGVRVVRVGVGHAIDKWLFPFLAPRTAARLQPNLLHAVLESFAGLALVRCRRTCPDVPRLLTCQSTNTSLFLRAIHRAADRVTCISRTLVERARRFGKEATLIPNGILLTDIARARTQTEKTPGRLLFVGRLEPMKGVDTLLRAFALLGTRASRTPELHLRIVGDGSLRASLKRLARSLGIAERVTFTGWLPAARVHAEIAAAPIFCGLSRSEALGNVFLEAQAAGCAVIATRVGGIPDIVHDGVTGLLVPPDNPDAAAATIRRLLEDNALRTRIAEAGARNAGHYDWDVIARQYAEVYDELLAR